MISLQASHLYGCCTPFRLFLPALYEKDESFGKSICQAQALENQSLCFSVVKKHRKTQTSKICEAGALAWRRKSKFRFWSFRLPSQPGSSDFSLRYVSQHNHCATFSKRNCAAVCHLPCPLLNLFSLESQIVCHNLPSICHYTRNFSTPIISLLQTRGVSSMLLTLY